MTALVLRPRRLRIAARAVIGLPLGAAGVAALAGGSWVGLVLLALGLLLLGLWAQMAFGRGYEVHVDDDGFRAHDVRGRVVHDVAWPEVASLHLVHLHAGPFGYGSVGFTCEPRRPKRGRIRWVRGTKADDGCLPESYRVDPVELLHLMRSRWQAATTASVTHIAFVAEPIA